MRHILVDLFRSGQYLKRGGGAERVSLDTSAVVSREARRDLLAIDEALKCKVTGEKKVIAFNLSGHGHFDTPALALRASAVQV